MVLFWPANSEPVTPFPGTDILQTSFSAPKRTFQINAGRDWIRLHLAATGLGLAMQPVSQALQEYPEMESHFALVHEALAAPGETVQMLGRLGYGPAIDASPRWPLEARIAHG